MQVKSQNGDLMQWEFGPVGGDSTLGRKAEATAAGLLRNPFVRGKEPKGQPAEIREEKVLPSTCLKCLPLNIRTRAWHNTQHSCPDLRSVY